MCKIYYTTYTTTTVILILFHARVRQFNACIEPAVLGITEKTITYKRQYPA